MKVGDTCNCMLASKIFKYIQVHLLLIEINVHRDREGKSYKYSYIMSVVINFSACKLIYVGTVAWKAKHWHWHILLRYRVMLKTSIVCFIPASA